MAPQLCDCCVYQNTPAGVIPVDKILPAPPPPLLPKPSHSPPPLDVSATSDAKPYPPPPPPVPPKPSPPPIASGPVGSGGVGGVNPSYPAPPPPIVEKEFGAIDVKGGTDSDRGMVFEIWSPPQWQGTEEASNVIMFESWHPPPPGLPPPPPPFNFELRAKGGVDLQPPDYPPPPPSPPTPASPTLPVSAPPALSLISDNIPLIPRIEGVQFDLHEPLWSTCSASCGSGIQTHPLVCVSTAMHTSAPLDVCMKHLGAPDDRASTCNAEACDDQSSYWKLGRWSHSSACCGGGRQVRSASCIVNGTVAEESLCSPMPHQLQLISSTTPCINFGWYTSMWSECSSQCGWGFAARQAQCVNLKNETAPDSFCPELKPQLHKDCYLMPCMQPVSQVAVADSMSGEGVVQGVQRRLQAVLSGQLTASISSSLPAPMIDRHSSDHRPQVTLRKLLSESDLTSEQESIQYGSLLLHMNLRFTSELRCTFLR